GASLVMKQRVTKSFAECLYEGGSESETWPCMTCKKPIPFDENGTAPMYCEECEAAKPPPTPESIAAWDVFHEVAEIDSSAHGYPSERDSVPPAECAEL